jgi:hypothetical protein
VSPTFPRRIVASAKRWKHTGLAFLGTMVLWAACAGGGLALVSALAGPRGSRDGAGLVVVGSGLLFTVLLFAIVLRPRPLTIDVWPDRVVLDEGREGVFPLATALLGAWEMPGYGVSMGTALHLSDGARRFCLGGRDHRPHPALRLAAPVVQDVDAYVTAADLDAVVALLPSVAGRVSAPVTNIVRISLVPNRASGRRAFAVMVPWLLTMGVVALLAVPFSLLGLDESPEGRVAMTVVLVAVVLGAMTLTVKRAVRRPTPTFVVQLEAQGLRVLDARTGAEVTAAHYAHVRCTQARHTYTGRSSYTMPALVLLVPGTKAMTVGIPDFRFSWPGDVRDCGSPDYVVGGADWRTLVDRLRPAP